MREGGERRNQGEVGGRAVAVGKKEVEAEEKRN